MFLCGCVFVVLAKIILIKKIKIFTIVIVFYIIIIIIKLFYHKITKKSYVIGEVKAKFYNYNKLV